MPIDSANLSFPQEFGIGSDQGRDQWLVGVINAAPYIASAGLGCWLSDPLNKYFGRRGTIFITAIILLATPIGSGFTRTWQELFVVRLILGIGMGAKGSTVPVLYVILMSVADAAKSVQCSALLKTPRRSFVAH